MNRCPELPDLEAFFDVPAKPAYGCEGGWYYDNLCFERRSTEEYVCCKLEPAEGAFSVLRVVDGQVQFDLSLQHVVSIDLEQSAGTALLIGHISHGGVKQLFKLAVKPAFSFRLVTALPSYE